MKNIKVSVLNEHTLRLEEDGKKGDLIDLKSIIDVDTKPILEAIKKVIEQCPPESAADILENGALLTGGGSLLKNIDVLLEKELKIKVNRVENPLLIVVEGLGITLDHLDLLNSMMLEYSPRNIQNEKAEKSHRSLEE